MKLIMENWKKFITEEEDTDDDGLTDSGELAAVEPRDPKSLILQVIAARVQELMKPDTKMFDALGMEKRVQDLNKLPALNDDVINFLTTAQFKGVIDKNIDNIAHYIKREFF
jgi:hypothetical protein